MRKTWIIFVILSIVAVFSISRADGFDPDALSQTSKAIAEWTLMNEDKVGTQIEPRVYVSSSLRGMVGEGDSEGIGMVIGLSAFDDDKYINTSKIDTQSLNRHTVERVGNYPIEIILNTAVPNIGRIPVGAGTAYSLWNTGNTMRNIWRVGTGRAEPDVLRSTVPHVVQAWDAIKGQKNLPNKTSITPIYRSYDDGALRIETYGIQKTRQTFSTTAYNTIGKYGYDPSIDTIIRQDTIYTTQRVTFSGTWKTIKIGESTYKYPSIDWTSIPKTNWSIPTTNSLPIYTPSMPKMPSSYSPSSIPKTYGPSIPSSWRRKY